VNSHEHGGGVPQTGGHFVRIVPPIDGAHSLVTESAVLESLRRVDQRAAPSVRADLDVGGRQTQKILHVLRQRVALQTQPGQAAARRAAVVLHELLHGVESLLWQQVATDSRWVGGQSQALLEAAHEKCALIVWHLLQQLRRQQRRHFLEEPALIPDVHEFVSSSFCEYFFDVGRSLQSGAGSPNYSMSDDSEQRQQPAPAAFQVPVDEENIAQTGGRRPRHLEQRMEDREGITAEVMTRRQAEAEERRKRKEAETIKRVSMHHEKVDKISKDAEDRKKRESVS
uniref:RUN domain-containing protein n=1 Tax=Macrostomum lignano TaxID=282301 RepID=A0A1I8I1B3_9PLAT